MSLPVLRWTNDKPVYALPLDPHVILAHSGCFPGPMMELIYVPHRHGALPTLYRMGPDYFWNLLHLWNPRLSHWEVGAEVYGAIVVEALMAGIIESRWQQCEASGEGGERCGECVECAHDGQDSCVTFPGHAHRWYREVRFTQCEDEWVPWAPGLEPEWFEHCRRHWPRRGDVP